MAASLSRPDPSSPASVAEAAFSTSRRGFSQDEVRAFLVSVAAELGRLQERERQLEAELNDLRAAGGATLEIDDATVERMLGEETLRVLQTARESASQIKIRAEENAARIIADANDEANRLRQDAEVEAARRRQDAAADAEAEVALAKQQGREMVTEARSYRERVLADLDRRTTLARKQIEELVHGRDRLLQVFERARLVAVDVTSDLRAIDGPDELVNLDPTTGPVPLMVPRDRAADSGHAVDLGDIDVAVHPDEDAEADTSGDADASEATDADDEPTEVEPADDVADDVPDPDPANRDEAEVESDAAESTDQDATDAAPDGGSDTTPQRDANVVSLFRGRAAPAADDEFDADADVDVDVDDEAGDDRPDVGGIFERLREETGDADGADDADGEPEPEPTAFTRRDEAIVPLIVGAGRKLKRVLADEQNGVLDALRQKEPVTELTAVVPDLDEHAARFVDAIADELQSAAAAGAGELGANDTKTLRRKLTKAGALEQAHQIVRRDLIAPLRDRLERSIADGAGDNDDITKRVRAVYREWKTQHIDDQLDDVVRAAHGGGLKAHVEPGTPLTWTVDPSEPACPDCEDNSLAGPVPAGDAYPTGHTSAPAHAGCRCLTLPASG